jgi:hypothetical protein
MSKKSKREWTTTEARAIRHTNKAILLQIAGSLNELWVPKSQIWNPPPLNSFAQTRISKWFYELHIADLSTENDVSSKGDTSPTTPNPLKNNNPK